MGIVKNHYITVGDYKRKLFCYSITFLQSQRYHFTKRFGSCVLNLFLA
jgi:hypothetical protein